MRLHAQDVRYLMRRGKVTIKALAEHMQIDINQVRAIRAAGVGGLACLDWCQGIDEVSQGHKSGSLDDDYGRLLTEYWAVKASKENHENRNESH